MGRVCVQVLVHVLVQVLVLLVLLVLLLLSSGSDSLKTHRDVRDNQPLKNDILEMLHINKMSVRRLNKAHPYMKRVYQSLDGTQDSGQSDGTLVHGLRSVDGPCNAPQGWIWFSFRDLQPPVQRAELVLFRKSLHLGPLTVSVTLHSLSASRGTVSEAPPRSRGTMSEAPPRSRGTMSEVGPLEDRSGGTMSEARPLEDRSGGTMREAPPLGERSGGIMREAPPLEERSGGTMSEAPPLGERLLALNHRPSSGFDVFDVSAWAVGGRTELVGFQLRYRDDKGSLVLHEALTQSLYSLDRGSVTEPLLVLYQSGFTTSSTGL